MLASRRPLAVRAGPSQPSRDNPGLCRLRVRINAVDSAGRLRRRMVTQVQWRVQTDSASFQAVTAGPALVLVVVGPAKLRRERPRARPVTRPAQRISHATRRRRPVQVASVPLARPVVGGMCSSRPLPVTTAAAAVRAAWHCRAPHPPRRARSGRSPRGVAPLHAEVRCGLRCGGRAAAARGAEAEEAGGGAVVAGGDVVEDPGEIRLLPLLDQLLRGQSLAHVFT
jgi:hypothetical protein